MLTMYLWFQTCLSSQNLTPEKTQNKRKKTLDHDPVVMP